MLSCLMIKYQFQDEEAEIVQKPKFISPFQRYKCVIPMIAELETKEQEIRKEEEEKRLSQTVKHENLDQTEIYKSKSRVYEHFKQISQSNEEIKEEVHLNEANIPKKPKKNKKKKKKNSAAILGNMPDRKRKRESDIVRKDIQAQEKTSDNNFCTPMPSLDTRIVHMSKKIKQEIQHTIEEQRVQENLTQVQGNKNNQVKSMR